MSDDPHQIADHLVKSYGLKGALTEAMSATAKANQEGDYYGLSVWREIKVILRDRQENQE